MKNAVPLMIFLFLKLLGIAQSEVNLNFWEITKDTNTSLLYPGNFTNSISPFDSFLNSVSRIESGIVETYLPNNTNNPFENFEPGKSYLFNVKENIKVMYIPGFDRPPGSGSINNSSYPWFIFPGQTPINLNLFDQKLHVVYRYDNASSGLLGYTPGDAFPLMSSFEQGGRYLVDNNNQEFLVAYSIPEPSTFSLSSIGISALFLLIKKNKKLK